MSFAATLDDLSFPELLHLISFNRKSGKLTLTCREGQALILFRQGKIIFAASDKLRQSFGAIMLHHGLITESDLLEALERQDRLEHERRLGSILVDMGKVSADSARKVLREQVQWAFAEVFGWRNGFFKFEPLEMVHGGETELDLDEALPREGFDTEEVLLEVVTRLDETVDDPAEQRKLPVDTTRSTGNGSRGGHFRVPPEWEQAASSPRMTRWASVIDEIRSPTFTGEIALALMRYAAQVVSRGLFLLVGSHEIVSMGQFGIPPERVSGSRRVRIPLAEPSVFRDVIARRESFRGTLSGHFWNDHFLHQLGGESPREVVVIPVILHGRVGFAFYGDNAHSGESIGSTRGLEFLMVEAGRAMEHLSREGRPASQLWLPDDRNLQGVPRSKH